MQVGELQSVAIPASQVWQSTGIVVNPGEQYRLAASGTWHDASIPSGPEGYPSPNALFRALEGLRRSPADNWFALIGALNQDKRTLFRIGSGTVFTARQPGTLCCFANDLRPMYWNNSGEVQLTVKRLR